MASPNGVESTWNDAFVKVMLDTIKKFIDGKKKETGQFAWLSGMENLGVAIDDVEVALIAQETRSELDEKGDQVDELDVRQFLNETLGMWVDAYTDLWQSIGGRGEATAGEESRTFSTWLGCEGHNGAQSCVRHNSERAWLGLVLVARRAARRASIRGPHRYVPCCRSVLCVLSFHAACSRPVL